jgi:hypothetical protein
MDQAFPKDADYEVTFDKAFIERWCEQRIEARVECARRRGRRYLEFLSAFSRSMLIRWLGILSLVIGLTVLIVNPDDLVGIAIFIPCGVVIITFSSPRFLSWYEAFCVRIARRFATSRITRAAVTRERMAPYQLRFEFRDDICRATIDSGGTQHTMRLSSRQAFAVQTDNLFLVNGRWREIGGIAFTNDEQRAIAEQFLRSNGVKIVTTEVS